MKKDIVIPLVIIALVYVAIAVCAFVVSPQYGWRMVAILVVGSTVGYLITSRRIKKAKATGKNPFDPKKERDILKKQFVLFLVLSAVTTICLVLAIVLA